MRRLIPVPHQSQGHNTGPLPLLSNPGRLFPPAVAATARHAAADAVPNAAGAALTVYL